MAPKLPRLTAAELQRALQRDGWRVARQRGISHAVLRHSTKTGRVVLPIHAGKTIPPWLLSDILRDAGLTADELRGLL